MSGYKTHRFSQEPDDYEGPWPKEQVMTAFPRCPECNGQRVPMNYVGDVIGAVCMCPVSKSTLYGPWNSFDMDNWSTFTQMLVAERDRLRAEVEALAAPAAPQQAEPVAQIGWADEFGNLFPMGAWKPAQRTHHDAHKTAWRPVFLHPHADEVQRLRDAARGVCDRARASQWAAGEDALVPASRLDALLAALEGK